MILRPCAAKPSATSVDETNELCRRTGVIARFPKQPKSGISPYRDLEYLHSALMRVSCVRAMESFLFEIYMAWIWRYSGLKAAPLLLRQGHSMSWKVMHFLGMSCWTSSFEGLSRSTDRLFTILGGLAQGLDSSQTKACAKQPHVVPSIFSCQSSQYTSSSKQHFTEDL